MKTREQLKRKRRKQRLIGVVLLLICAAVLFLCAYGKTVRDRDGTAVLLLAPLGIWLIFSKEILIY